jgi:hypothetical protein
MTAIADRAVEMGGHRVHALYLPCGARQRKYSMTGR